MVMTNPKKKASGSQADGIRGTLWYFFPHELTIVGHDTDEQEHELCDHESNSFAAETYEEYVNYMRLNGIDKPIIFRRDGDRKLVVEGRTTVRVARVVAPLWEQDRKAEGLRGEDLEDAKLKIPAVVRRGTADQLFCVSRAANRRRPGSVTDLGDAKALARLTNNGMPEVQAAVRLGLPPARAKQLLALLQLHPKIQRRVGIDVSLDAASKLAKLTEKEQIAKVAELAAAGARPTARAVTNKLREGSGKAPVESPSQKLKRIVRLIAKIGPTTDFEQHDEQEQHGMMIDVIDQIRAILRPPADGAAPPETGPRCARCNRFKVTSDGENYDPVCVCGHRHAVEKPAAQEAEFGA
jgi:hypothetical protein